MGQRAYRARLSLTPDELEAVQQLVQARRYRDLDSEMNDAPFWGKLLDKVERARKRNAAYPFDPDHVAMAFNFEEPEES